VKYLYLMFMCMVETTAGSYVIFIYIPQHLTLCILSFDNLRVFSENESFYAVNCLFYVKFLRWTLH
jgi:hypothetical protein